MQSHCAQVPDTKVYFYNEAVEKIQSYEFGPSFYPVEHFWDVNESKLIAGESFSMFFYFMCVMCLMNLCVCPSNRLQWKATE